jgi:uncharacterized membrane protein
MEMILLLVALVFFGGGLIGIAAFILALSHGREAALQRRTLAEIKVRINGIEQQLKNLMRVKPAEAPAPPAAEGSAVFPAAEEPVVIAAAPPPAEEPGTLTPKPPESVSAPTPSRPVEGQAGLEEIVGKRWLTWVGILLLFLGISFFLKYAIDNRWLDSTARVVLGFIAGIVMLVYGDRFVRRPMRVLGQGLMGGGLAVLFASLYAAFALYHLISQTGAFLAMSCLTALGMTLAVVHDSPSLSVLAVLGGFLTPVMASTRRNARDELFCYLILLNLGVLGVASLRKWRALELLSFIGTWLLYGGWYAHHYEEAQLLPALLWAFGFYLAFLALPFAYHLRTATPMALDRFFIAMANAVVFFSYCWSMLYEDHRYILGFIALAMSGCYVWLGSAVRGRAPEDRTSLFGFVTLSVVFLTMAIPLHLSLNGITLAWALEGPALCYLGFRFRYQPVRIFGFLVMVLATFRLFLFHWPLHPWRFTLFVNPQFVSALFLVAAAAAFTVIQRLWSREGDEIDRGMRVISILGAGFLALVITGGELWEWFQQIEEFYLGKCSLVYLWAVGAFIFLAAGIIKRSLTYRIAGVGALIVSGFIAIIMGGPPRYEDNLLFSEPGFYARLAAVLAVFGYAYVLRRCRTVCEREETQLSTFFDVTAVLALLFLLSMRAYNCGYLQAGAWAAKSWTAQMAFSVTWSVYAVALLIVGLWRRVRWLRVTALCVFLFTAVKVVFVDMAQIQEIYRIISFLVLGFLMIEAAYLYHRLEKRIGHSSGG